MPPRKPQTVIAELKRENRILLRQLAQKQAAGCAAVGQTMAAEARATKAEQDVAEWKRRFDELLARVPLAGIEAARRDLFVAAIVSGLGEVVWSHDTDPERTALANRIGLMADDLVAERKRRSQEEPRS